MKTSPLKKKETTKLGVFPNPAMSKKDLEKSQPQTRPFSQKRIRKNQRIQRTHWQPNHKHLSYTYGFPTTRRLHSGLIKSEGLMCTADPEKLWKQHESVPKKLDTCVTCFTIQEFHIYYQYMSSVCLYVTSCAAALQMISFDWHHKKEIHSIYIYIYLGLYIPFCQKFKLNKSILVTFVFSNKVSSLDSSGDPELMTCDVRILTYDPHYSAQRN